MTSDLNADSTEEGKKSRLSVAWVLLSLALGAAAAVLVGRIYTEGPAEIAGIMVASLVAGTRTFWDWRVRPWFVPLIVGWAIVHLVVLLFVVIPLNVRQSRTLINLVWVEFFAFAGLVWLASRLWGGLPE